MFARLCKVGLVAVGPQVLHGIVLAPIVRPDSGAIDDDLETEFWADHRKSARYTPFQAWDRHSREALRETRQNDSCALLQPRPFSEFFGPVCVLALP